jgi:hypothetical protein
VWGGFNISEVADSDFEIVNGVLIRYHGMGGNVTIPNSVTTIGDFAFSACHSLTSVTIPNSVTTINDYAFQNCHLRDVYVGWTSPLTITAEVFSDVTLASSNLHVPSGTEAVYQSAPV